MKRYFGFDENLNLKKDKEIKENKNNKKNNFDFFSIAKLSSIGYYLVVPIFFGISFGSLLDFLLKTKKNFFTIGFLIGLLGVFYNFKKIYTDLKN
ncbi:MAG: AtpZ/AtpI family protein, partial [Patescibacteria group bacterium]|nr:AtpZ/AtpI family protein [Patescibacteria group bacterium]